MIRLAVRVDREQAELVLAQLLELARHRATPFPAAVAAGLLGQATVAAADVAHHRAHHLPEGGAGRRLELPGTTTAVARLDRRPRLGAIAAAALASRDRIESDLYPGAASGFEQADLDRHRDVFARGGTGTGREHAAAEEGVEQIADRREAVEVGRESAG